MRNLLKLLMNPHKTILGMSRRQSLYLGSLLLLMVLLPRSVPMVIGNHKANASVANTCNRLILWDDWKLCKTIPNNCCVALVPGRTLDNRDRGPLGDTATNIPQQQERPCYWDKIMPPLPPPNGNNTLHRHVIPNCLSIIERTMTIHC